MTLADHQKLEAQLATVAQADGVTLPTTPNASQQQTAATLTAAPAASFDLAYASAEVQGHQLAISAAQTETTAGSDPATKSYASGYIPIATMHLDMATSEVSALSGSSAPTSVSAGTGGRAQTDLATSPTWIGGTAAGFVLVAGSGAALARRRRA